jgi:low affinity Fe/Cu permease
MFNRLACAVSHAAGTPLAFATAALIILVWAITGPFFGYSDTWQLVINTGTTIITFLMVFLIQNTQNRDGAAIQAKLDELIRATTAARDEFRGLDRRDENEIEAIRDK